MNFRIVATAILFALPFAAHADGGQSSRAAQFEAQLSQRFTAADTNGDGRLTPDEAKAGMPMVYRQFDNIDSGHKGYVTKDDILAAMQQRMMARGAGRQGQ
jgi:RNase H-fold protein (predicted Holliday junction resolvase)